MPRRTDPLGISLILVSGVCSGSVSLFAALLSQEGVTGWFQLAARLAICVVGLLVFLLATAPHVIRIRDRRTLLSLAQNGALLLGSFGTYIFSIALGTAPTKAILLTHLAPIYVAILGSVLLGEKIRARQLGAAALGLSGLAVMLRVWDTEGVTRFQTGDLLAALNAPIYAGTIVYGRWSGLRAEVDPMGLTFWSMTFALLWLVALGLVASLWIGVPTLLTPMTSAVSFRTVAYLVGMALPGTALSYALFYSGLRRTEASTASILRLAVPASVFVLSAVFLREPTDWWQVAGGVLVLAAGVIVSR